MRSGSPQSVLFMGDTGGWHCQADKGKTVSTLKNQGNSGNRLRT